MRPSRSNMPGLAHRGKEMKHKWNALRTILVCVASLGAPAISALAAPGDQPNPTDKFKTLEFREIGPATMGGRIDDFAVVESNPNIVYVGTASGGVWKTTNNGTTWEPIFDKESVSTIGDIAMRRRIPRWCGWEPASPTTGKALPGEMERTSRSTAGRPGRRWGWRPRGTSAGLSFIQRIQMWSTWQRSGTCGPRIRIAESIRRRTAGKRGRRS